MAKGSRCLRGSIRTGETVSQQDRLPVQGSQEPGNNTIKFLVENYPGVLAICSGISHDKHMSNTFLGNFCFAFPFLKCHILNTIFFFRRKSWGKVENRSTSTSMTTCMCSLKCSHPQRKLMPGWGTPWKRSRSSSSLSVLFTGDWLVSFLKASMIWFLLVIYVTPCVKSFLFVLLCRHQGTSF